MTISPRLERVLATRTILFATGIGIALAASIGGCAGAPGSSDDHDDSSGSASAMPEDAFRVEISSLRRQTLGITFANVERRNVEGTFRIPGSFEATPEARYEYRIPLAGTIEVLVERYDEVEAGRPLFRYHSPAWLELRGAISAAESAVDTAITATALAIARVDEAENRLALTNERLARSKKAGFENADLAAEARAIESSLPPLRAEHAHASSVQRSREREFQDALARAAAITGIPSESLAKESKTATVPTRDYRTLDWIEVRAAAPGVVASVEAPRSGFVDADRLVLTTLDPNRVTFRGRMLQRDASSLEGEVDARLHAVGSITERPPGEPARAFAGLEADPRARTVDIVARPETVRPWMRPGIAAELELVTESSGGPALAIPRAALVRDGIDLVFFRRDPDDSNRAFRVEADLGATDGTWIVVHSGVALGDEIVLDGAYELVLALASTSAKPKGGHMHADGTFHEDH